VAVWANVANFTFALIIQFKPHFAQIATLELKQANGTHGGVTALVRIK
jgi:hypothetical protein